MFQFRRFPTYTYLIQCTLHGYCPCGLPHSEIHGLTDICSSPWLIAACHVLLRLLMPRHSPCALSSLTCSSQSPLFSVSALSLRLCAKTAFAPLLLASNSNPFHWALSWSQDGSCVLSTSVREILVLFENYAGSQRSFEIVIVTHTSFQMLFHNYCFRFLCFITETSLLPYFTLHSHCSVFKVHFAFPIFAESLYPAKSGETPSSLF